MHEIKLYGEVVPFQDAWIIEQGGYINLTLVQNLLKGANGAEVKVRINSVGGDVDEGFAIYSELRRYAKDNNVKVHTLAEGRCASIATVFFLAGDTRTITEYTQPFVHNAWTYAIGDANTIQRIATDLENCNQRIAEHYARHTDLTYEEAREMMDGETSITPTEAVNMRFATAIEEVLRPVALQRFNKQPINNKKMTKKKGAWAKIKEILNGFSNKIVFTADQREVDFYELEEDEVIEVGANATIDGAPATGEIVMESGETYIFTDGVLSEIREADEEDTDEDPSAIEALQTEIAALKQTNADLQAKFTALQAANKKNREIIKKLEALESDDDLDDPKPTPPKNTKQPVKTDLDKALESLKNVKLK